VPGDASHERGAREAARESREGSSQGWQTDKERARHEIADYLRHLATLSADSSGQTQDASAGGERGKFGIKSYLLCSGAKTSCAPAARMLVAVGFTAPIFVSLLDSEAEGGEGSGGDHSRLLDEIASGAHESVGWVGIFRDDIVLTTSPRSAAERIRGAMQDLPVSADTLHLTYEFDACRKARFSASNSFASTAHQPFGISAVSGVPGFFCLPCRTLLLMEKGGASAGALLDRSAAQTACPPASCVSSRPPSFPPIRSRRCHRCGVCAAQAVVLQAPRPCLRPRHRQSGLLFHLPSPPKQHCRALKPKCQACWAVASSSRLRASF